MTISDRLETIRVDGWRRWIFALAGGLLGLVLATTHWIGFLIGGALVAVPQRSIVRGIVSGTGYGVLVWGVFLATLALDGTAASYVEMGQVFYLSVAIPVLTAFLGSLVRAIG